MGNVTLNLRIAGLIVRHAIIQNDFLVPDNNSVQAHGTANIRTLLSGLPHLLAAEASATNKGNIERQARVNKTVYKGYFDEVPNKPEMSAQTPLFGLIMDSAAGILGNSGGIKNFTRGLLDVNVTDLIPVLGLETDINNNGNSPLLDMLGMKACRALAQTREVNIPITLAPRNSHLIKRAPAFQPHQCNSVRELSASRRATAQHVSKPFYRATNRT